MRHAEPARGASNDPLLSCAGLAQAERLAERLRSVWIEAVYVAPERRAVQTANVLSTALDRPQYVIQGLAEIEFDASEIDEPEEMAPTFGRAVHNRTAMGQPAGLWLQPGVPASSNPGY